MKGRYVCKCVVCGLEKGTGDSNQGWWIFVSRDTSPRRRTVQGLHYCPACSPALLVRSDEMQAAPVPSRVRIIQVRDLCLMLAALQSAARGFNPRETLGWRAAEVVAPIVGVKGFPKALPCREFGFVPEESR